MLGGLVLYQEALHVGPLNLCMMGVGILLICFGCGLVGQRKALPRRFMPGAVVAHRMITFRVKRQKRHQQLAEVTGPPLAGGPKHPPLSPQVRTAASRTNGASDLSLSVYTVDASMVAQSVQPARRSSTSVLLEDTISSSPLGLRV